MQLVQHNACNIVTGWDCGFTTEK